ncbi:MAG: hypothetical protein IRZ07_21325, partial [Microbispora sp.]|nr:hypothetical protein [Microbispora sp.]
TSRDLLLELVGTTPGPASAGLPPAEPRQGVMAPPYDPGESTSPQADPGGKPGAADTVPARGRGSRTRVLAGAGTAVAALGITAALLVPRLAPASGGPSPTRSPSAAAASTYAADPTPGGYGPGDTSGTTPSIGPAPNGVPQAFAGKWRGHIVPAYGLTSEYDIEIELKSGKPTGTWKEPANSCEGTLRLTGASGSALVFRLEDVPGCVPGDVVLTPKGDALAYRHTDDLRLFAYEGTLTKKS